MRDMIDYRAIQQQLQRLLEAERRLWKSAPHPGEVPVVREVHNQKTGATYPETYYTKPHQPTAPHPGKRPPARDAYPGSFANEAAAEKVLGTPGDANGELEKWYKHLTEDHKHAILQYTGRWYMTMNGLNRKTLNPGTIPPQDLSKARRWMKLIEEALSTYVLKQDVVLHRQVKQDMLPLFQKSFKSPDRLFTEPGFFSSTPVIDSFRRPNTIDLVVKVPKGKGRGAWIKYLSKYPREREFLLNSYSTFTVDSIQKIDGKWRVELTYVGRMEPNKS